jgi:hypothetical protein
MAHGLRGGIHVVAGTDIGAMNGSGRLALRDEVFEANAVGVKEFQDDATFRQFKRERLAQSACSTCDQRDHMNRS